MTKNLESEASLCRVQGHHSRAVVTLNDYLWLPGPQFPASMQLRLDNAPGLPVQGLAARRQGKQCQGCAGRGGRVASVDAPEQPGQVLSPLLHPATS